MELIIQAKAEKLLRQMFISYNYEHKKEIRNADEMRCAIICFEHYVEHVLRDAYLDTNDEPEWEVD